ncbi:SAGA-associated factor 29 homolog A isoform X1 [Selaginella moellendorffii]|uniref:SAGA-associated factor 29 homolog A isoform X1 n=1 Tax=Selaginella moellendorffii TaxID=88036 RepID=UPI000D1CCA2E|nr:SAGA-associated factor 29 homolog A isoform X1 [Selaginella moellendorffii]|eukprot:XP_024529160.1 SAGA-associated factor 29 homolog A isoform X1 [Selaginella moellendorffii]
MASNALSAASVEAASQGLKELDRLRREQDGLIKKINKIHAKLAETQPEQAEKFEDKFWSKLRDLYSQAKALADAEESASNACLSNLDALSIPSQAAAAHRRKTETGDQKRKRAKADADSSRLNPNVSRSADSIGKAVGDQVAARITPEDSEKSEWIVVKVTRFDRETNKLSHSFCSSFFTVLCLSRYEVIDEEPGDEEENGGTGGPRKYKLSPSAIIQFPKPATALDFPTGSQVLAVYPGTTALYKATVVGPHRKKKTDDYILEFDDDDEDGFLPKRTVPFYHVVTLPEGHRQ